MNLFWDIIRLLREVGDFDLVCIVGDAHDPCSVLDTSPEVCLGARTVSDSESIYDDFYMSSSAAWLGVSSVSAPRSQPSSGFC